MPGVPSGKACDGCRKQRKKCDQAKPACSRCQRLNLPCVGAGEQRYVFKLQSGTKSPPRETLDVVKGSSVERDPMAGWDRPLANESTLLLSRFVQMVQPTLDIRHSMYWTYGSFLGDVPRRLGASQALDTCVDALTSAHVDYCVNPMSISAPTLQTHSRALRAVRESLASPATARTSETLCAVYLLLLCQVFVSSQENRANHALGAAQILKLRGYYEPQHEFERELLFSLRGPVLFTALFDDGISFTPDEWQTIVQNHLDGSSVEGQLLCCLARVPALLRRGRILRQTLSVDRDLIKDIQIQYEQAKTALNELRTRCRGLEQNPSERQLQLGRQIPLHALWQRSYGLGLMVVTILNCMLSATDAGDVSLGADSVQFAKEVVSLARAAHCYRPLGSSYIVLCLALAWAATTDPGLRSSIMHELASYQQDMRSDMSVTKLQQTRDKLQFARINVVWC